MLDTSIQTIDVVFHLASIMNWKDFRREERTIDGLGIGGMEI